MRHINFDLQASHKMLIQLDNATANIESVIDLIPGIFLIINEDREILRANSEFLSLTGLNTENMLRVPLAHYFTDEDWAIFSANVEKLLNASDSDRASTASGDSEVAAEVTSNVLKFEVMLQTRRTGVEHKPFYWSLTRLNAHSPGEGSLLSVFGQDMSAMRYVVEQTEALRVARDAAESANRAKSQFLANLSHEVRTPLHGILGMSSLLEMSELDDEQNIYLKELNNSSKSLQGMLERILDFAQIEAGAVKIVVSPFELREIAETISRHHLKAAEKKGLTLSLHFAEQLPELVCGDGNRLLQILDDLLDNAIKFSVAGSIHLEVGPGDVPPGESSANQLWIKFSVSDQGLGIHPEQRAVIFEAFSQADGSITRKAGGNGLGLAICRSLIHLMGGELDLDSRLGAGSVFHVNLPFKVFDEETA